MSIGKRNFNWVVGLFYLDDTVDTLSERDDRDNTDFVTSNSTFQTSAHNTLKSAFAQVNYFIIRPIEVVASARYSEDARVYNRIILAGPVPTGASLIGTQQSDKWTGKIGINYHVGRNLPYLTTSQGHKAGGVNSTVGTPNCEPETDRAYELDLKTQFLDNRMQVTGDIFYSNYRDIQLSSLLAGLPVTQNAAGKSYGGELKVTGQFGDWGFDAGHLHARFDGNARITDTNANGADPGCATNLRLVPDGRVLPFSPTRTINAGTQYEIPLRGEMSTTPRVQWSHLSQQVATPFPSANTIVPAATCSMRASRCRSTLNTSSKAMFPTSPTKSTSPPRFRIRRVPTAAASMVPRAPTTFVPSRHSRNARNA